MGEIAEAVDPVDVAADPIGGSARAHSTIPTPITALAHLAGAARRCGDIDRIINVDAPDPPVVRTPGRRLNQWLLSGEMLEIPGTCPICGWWRDGACQCG